MSCGNGEALLLLRSSCLGEYSDIIGLAGKRL